MGCIVYFRFLISKKLFEITYGSQALPCEWGPSCACGEPTGTCLLTFESEVRHVSGRTRMLPIDLACDTHSRS